MPTFVPNNGNLRKALLFCFHLKKTAATSRLLLEEAYESYSPSISTCEYWLQRFKSGLITLTPSVKIVWIPRPHIVINAKNEYLWIQAHALYLVGSAGHHISSVKSVKKYLEALKWGVLPHPPYSPDVAPSDYYLFRSHMAWLTSTSPLTRKRKNGSHQKTNYSSELMFANNKKNSNAECHTSGFRSHCRKQFNSSGTIHSLIARYSDSREEDVPSQPSGPRDRAESTNDLSSNNENSDDDADDPEEPDWFYQRHSSNPNGSNNSRHLYRTNNVNLAPQPSIILPRASVRFWNVPSVQVNDVPVSEPSVFSVHRLMAHRRFAERVSELRYSSAQRANPRVGLFRPRFLHPLYASLNPFDADLDDPQRDQIYDSDMIATVTPNHRIQVWDISNGQIPGISNYFN
ncbi:hypothetical protein YQE_10445, partial [Dendroctonus ponderosae]